jgi:hypothetical protein
VDNNLINKISKVLKKPYVSDLLSLSVPQKYWETIFKKIYGDVTITEVETDDPNGMIVPDQYFFFSVRKYIRNIGSVLVYYEGWDGDWVEMVYDDRGNKLGYEDELGYSQTEDTNNINESVNKKLNKYLDKVVDFVLRDTKYKVGHISFGFSPNYKEVKVDIKFPMYRDLGSYARHEVEDWSSAEISDTEYAYFADNYGLNWEESQIVFEKMVFKLKKNILDEIKLKYGE